MRTIAVLNQKGGVGKTTTTVNIAAALAAAGSRVVVIDLDPQAHLTIHLGLEPQAIEAGSYKVLTHSANFEEEILLVRPNLWLLPANINLVGAESELVSVVGREIILREAIQSSQDKFDYCLIDCAPSLGLLTLNALAASQEVLIPLQPHFLALQGFGQLLQTVELVNKRINPNLKVKGILLCMFDSRASLPNEVKADIEQFLINARGTNSAWADAKILPTFIRRNIKLAEAPSYGKTIFEYEQNCHGAQDYAKVAEFVHAQYQVPAHTEEPLSVETEEISEESDYPESPLSQTESVLAVDEQEETPVVDDSSLRTESDLTADGQDEAPIAVDTPEQADVQEPAESIPQPLSTDDNRPQPPFEIRSIEQPDSYRPTDFTQTAGEPHRTDETEYAGF